MPKILGPTDVAGALTATSVNGIIGLNSDHQAIKPNGDNAFAGISNYVARADHIHPGIGGSTGPIALNDLTDVDTTTNSPSDGQVLIYDSTNSLQKPGTITGAGEVLSNGFEKVMSVYGNGTANYSLDKLVSHVLVFIDGLLQNDYTVIVGPSTAIVSLGFIPRSDSLIEAYTFNTMAEVQPVPEVPHQFLLMGA